MEKKKPKNKKTLTLSILLMRITFQSQWIEADAPHIIAYTPYYSNTTKETSVLSLHKAEILCCKAY